MVEFPQAVYDHGRTHTHTDIPKTKCLRTVLMVAESYRHPFPYYLTDFVCFTKLQLVMRSFTTPRFTFFRASTGGANSRLTPPPPVSATVTKLQRKLNRKVSMIKSHVFHADKVRFGSFVELHDPKTGRGPIRRNSTHVLHGQFYCE